MITTTLLIARNNQIQTVKELGKEAAKQFLTSNLMIILFWKPPTVREGHTNHLWLNYLLFIFLHGRYKKIITLKVCKRNKKTYVLYIAYVWNICLIQKYTFVHKYKAY